MNTEKLQRWVDRLDRVAPIFTVLMVAGLTVIAIAAFRAGQWVAGVGAVLFAIGGVGYDITRWLERKGKGPGWRRD